MVVERARAIVYLRFSDAASDAPGLNQLGTFLQAADSGLVRDRTEPGSKSRARRPDSMNSRTASTAYSYSPTL